MRIKNLKTRFNRGQISADILARPDTDQYYSGAEDMTNTMPLPEGGAIRRYGLEHCDIISGTGVRITSGVTITCPNGGTTSYANDDDTSDASRVLTSGVGTINPFVVIHYDLGSPKLITNVELRRAWDSSTDTMTDFYIQGSTDNVSWTNIGSSITLTTTPTWYTRTANTTYRYIRFARIGSTDFGGAFVLVGDLSVYEDSGVTNVKLIPFVYSEDQSYVLVLTSGNIAVYQGGVKVEDISSPYNSEQVLDVDYSQDGNTMLLFHGNIQTRELVRSADATTWTLSTVTYTSIPRSYFDGSRGSNEVQEVSMISWDASDTYTVVLDGVQSASITLGGSDAAAASNLQAGLRALSNTSSTGITVTVLSGQRYQVTFGGGDGLKPWPLIQVYGKNTAKVTRTVAGGEDIWSAYRGWPRHGAFHEGRLYVDGGLSRPTVVYGSIVNSPYNFYFGTGLDDEAIGPWGFDGYNNIENIISSKSLTVFTSAGEYIIPQTNSEGITPARSYPKNRTKIGSEGGLKAQEADGGIFYYQKGGAAVRKFINDETQNLFENNIASFLSSDIVSDPTNMCTREVSGSDQYSYVLITRADGSLTISSILESEKISAFSPITTDGAFVDCCNDAGDMYFAVIRQIDGISKICLERFNPDCLLDSSILFESGFSTTVTGLDHLEGEDVYAVVDGLTSDTEFTVISGSITLPSAPTESLEVGRGFIFTIKDVPVEVPEIGSSLGNKMNISEIVLNLEDTSDITVNGKPIGLADTRFTGLKRIMGTRGWSATGQVTITQTKPSPFKIRELSKRVNV